MVYFRKGVSRRQVREFYSSVLFSSAESRQFPALVRESSHFRASDFNGHETIVLYFFQKSLADKVDAYLATIKADKRVEKVEEQFHDRLERSNGRLRKKCTNS